MLYVIKHPLIDDKLTRMRNKETPSILFRSNLTEITQLMSFELTKNFKTIPHDVFTPICAHIGSKIANNIVIVPILRAGLGMADALYSLIPNASIGHIGLYRDEKTLKSIRYYNKIPSITNNANVIICDPMLATGNTIVTAIDIIKANHNPAKIVVLGLVAAPEGIKKIQEHYPDIDIFVAALDEKLNEIGYIVPGLGDAGDRIFKTK